ncbi:polyketide cyclase [Actinocrispum wychmicini]|uniref:Polyketide cyclase/dehydrase/lipid transport protein n=1 Tax=Actinocrispum wychmicini TaxID=1213861 RepID=A0A4R2J7H2_9PSEU|nr:polyketide cyclase [Actinocrispum wychmicini]TCO55051.1 hypothetical protein EV192_108339 [Actinocrispum wychmicini]
MITASNWGATETERARPYPAGDCLTGPVRVLDRAVTVHAPADLMYRWMCQISLAPYSYDLVDNWGRRSPTELVPGTENLTVGQRLMVFDLVDVQPGHQFTGRGLPSAERLFGRMAITYAAEPAGPDSCRLVCRLVVDRHLRGRLMAWGDLLMTRKQLLTLKKYAERDHRRGLPG